MAARGGGEPPSPDPPPEIEPIVLAVLEARVKEAKAAARATIEHLYAEGTRSPLEANLDNAEYVDGIAGTNEQAIAVLAEHALELLARIEHVKASTVNAAVVAAARAEEPLPGIERFKARGSLVGRPDRNAGQAAEWLVQAGVMPWDGRPFCSGQAADESKLRGYKPRPCERSAAA